MKRERIVTKTKELVREKYQTTLSGAEKPAEGIETVPVEELVAISSQNLGKMNVYNARGEKLGKIEDLMIDLKSGRIAYAVLSFYGFLGMGNKFFAIPWEQLCVDNQWNYRDIYKHRIIFNVPKEKLAQAPGFDKDKWPSEPDRAWLSQVYEYYGCRPYWEPPEEATKVRPPSA